ncbi:unnamed protein product [Hymenolepis diminuta]|uniref:RFX-type winged-helix domain-containing protein n=2 Tax=Hymenolepis diminuta TaxID=6216 RepID=A0A0R3SHV4_HYMDI|nr:unnamed protein product [Hymenolepis diminuta]
MNQQSQQIPRVIPPVDISTPLSVHGSNSVLINSELSAKTSMIARMAHQNNTNNSNYGQYYLRFLRHHSTRASPVTVHWLLQNYETAEGVSLPRSLLYSHYLNHCLDYWLEPMNPASFGKLIRSVFVGLRTRRLGTRMQKYQNHSAVYSGGNSTSASTSSNVFSKFRSIRANNTAGHIQTLLSDRYANPRSSNLPTMVKSRSDNLYSGGGVKQAPASTSSTSAFRPYDTIKGIKNGSSSSLYDWKGAEGVAEETEPSDLTIASGHLTALNEQGMGNEDRLYFGSGNQQPNLPNFMDLCQLVGIDLSPGSNSFPVDLSMDATGNHSKQVKAEIPERVATIQFVKLYEQHCAEVYEAILTPQLEKLRNIWQRFWSPCDVLTKDLGQKDPGNNSHSNSETRLNKMQLALINNRKCLCLFVEIADKALYQTLLEIIVSDSLKSMPPSLLHTVRMMIKRMQHCLRSAIRHLSPTLINCKLTAISGFIKGLRRVIGLANLSRAADQIFDSPERLEQMRLDIQKLDLASIESQGSWASDCLPSWTLFTERSLLANVAILSTTAHEISNKSNSISVNNPTRLKIASFLNSTVNDSMQPMSQLESSMGFPLTMVQLHSELQHLLSANATLACLIAWLDRIVMRGSDEYVIGPKRANAARQFMLVWNYYSSLLIRELTLRSASSFNSCYLIRMLCDEYLSFRLEQIAESPLLSIPSRCNITSAGPHRLEGCVCCKGSSSPNLLSENVSEAEVNLTSTTGEGSNENEADIAAATLLTTFNSREEEEEGSRDLETESPWEQAISSNCFTYFDGCQTTSDSLAAAPSMVLAGSDSMWTSFPFPGNALGIQSFADEDAIAMAAIEPTQTASTSATQTPPQMNMLPVFPDQIPIKLSPPSQGIMNADEKDISSVKEIGNEKEIGGLEGNPNNEMALKAS